MSRIEKLMENCTLCPRACNVDRTQGETGICGQTDRLKVARAALHMWEEPCISGTKGSGTVFFAGCGLRCVFCQNHEIARGGIGKEITVERLAGIFLELQEQGANNINLVTAGQFAPQAAAALKLAKNQGLVLPVVYNTSAYEEVEAFKLLEGCVDVYLPDLKYIDSALSGRYSRAADYFEKAKAAIAEMVRQAGEMEFLEETAIAEMVRQLGEVTIGKPVRQSGEPTLGEPIRQSGEAEFLAKTAIGGRLPLNVEAYQRRSEQGESLIMTKGVIVRHLLLPGCTEDSKRVLEYLLREYGERIFISIMNQYTPLPHVAAWPELNRRVTEAEYEEVLDYAIELGIENGFMQEGETAKESFIPAFDESGV